MTPPSDGGRETGTDAAPPPEPPKKTLVATVSERTGYPTQKPTALLDRIIRCASPEGGLVVDYHR